MQRVPLTVSRSEASFRPGYHFCAAEQWINDPNGLVYINGVFHLFFQCNPFGTEWGNMSWGHATSGDLIHWQELPVALPQREQGGRTESIFSGSCILDRNNVSGLGGPGQVPLLAFYTSHYSQAPDGMGRQAQSLAYSLDDGVTWQFYDNGPLIYLQPNNPEGYNANEFRDPRVFFHSPSGYWIMVLVLAVDRTILFYRSRNLLDWQRTSTFSDPGHNPHDLWEVPDLVEVPVEGRDDRRWVLLLSVNTTGLHRDAGSTQHYFSGYFDGLHFKFDATETPPIRDGDHPGYNRMDWGRDYYAAVTFHNAPGDRPLAMAWMNNWRYANEVPHQGFRGQMALARRLTLRVVQQQALLLSDPIQPAVTETESLMSLIRLSDGERWATSITDPPDQLQLKTESFREGQIVLTLNYGDQCIGLTLDADQGQVHLDRRGMGSNNVPDAFPAQDTVYERLLDDAGVTIVLDRSSIEVFSLDRTWSITQQIFPRATLEWASVEYHSASERHLGPLVSLTASLF